MGKPQIIINKIMTIGIVLLIEQIGLIQIEIMGLMIIIFIKDLVLLKFHQKKFLIKIILIWMEIIIIIIIEYLERKVILLNFIMKWIKFV